MVGLACRLALLLMVGLACRLALSTAGVAHHRFDAGDSGARRWVTGGEAGTPADRALAAAVADDHAQRLDERFAVTKAHGASVGFELGSLANEIGHRI